MSTRLAAAVLLASTTMAAAAVQITLTPRDVTEALSIGRSRVDRDLARFHEPYRLRVARPPVDYVEVITPFRRVVREAESRMQLGDATFGQRQALEMLAAAPAAIELHAEFTFHPHNTYVGVPDYVVTLARANSRLAARTFEQHPRYGPRVAGAPLPLPIPGGPVLTGASEPLSGGTVVAHFDAQLIDPAGVYDVVIEELGKELARVRVDFGQLR